MIVLPPNSSQSSFGKSFFACLTSSPNCLRLKIIMRLPPQVASRLFVIDELGNRRIRAANFATPIARNFKSVISQQVTRQQFNSPTPRINFKASVACKVLITPPMTLMNYLSLKVRQVNRVEVDKPDMPDARRRKIHCRRGAESARADYQHL